MAKVFTLLTKKIIYFFLLIVIAINSSFFVQTDDECIVPKVNSDLSWIQEYTALYNLFNQDQWEKNPTHSFDSLGVHILKNNYHPVNASHYALYCYDEYLHGKNERFKKAFLAQISFFRDSTKYKEVDGNKVGFPYLMAFHDLKAPWFSSLAQGEAISVLIRYYALTKDASILPLIVKVKNFMVTPMEKGGCLGITPEGYEWFEEYPNSKQELHNFSGYYSAVIAMGEYSKLFPDDTASFNLYSRTLYAGKMSNKIYDSGGGIFYNRGDKRLCSFGYLKWMTNLMQHVEEFTGDVFFKYQHMIWSTYSYGKDYVDVGVKKNYYNWSVPITKTKDNQFFCADPSQKKVGAEAVKEVKAESKNVNVKLAFDDNLKTSIKLNGSNTVSEPNTIAVVFTKDIETDNISLNLQQDSVKRKLKIDVFYKTNDSNKWQKLKNIKTEEVENEISRLKFKKLKFNELKLVFKNKNSIPIIVREIQITESFIADNPEFMFYKTGAISVKDEKVNLTCVFEPGIKHWIFYRTANTSPSLNTTPFLAENANTNETIPTNTKDKFIEYLIMCEYKKPGNGIKKLNIE